MEFVGKLGKYRIIKTDDDTQTLFSEYFDEACHNLSGAYHETIHNYIEGCQIRAQIASGRDIHVLDVGFGLGIGLLALLDEYKYTAPKKNVVLTYTSIELDEDLLLWSIKTNFSELHFVRYASHYACKIQLQDEVFLTVVVYVGDGRKTLPEAKEKNLLPKFTAIFQDAFSPKKNPALWSVEWFSELRSLSDDEVYLSTYSSSLSIRKSLIASGWAIENAKGFGQKRTMTKARLIGETDPLLMAELSKSKALELRDN